MTIDEVTKKPFPVDVGFKIDNIQGWPGQFYCEFGQVNNRNELSGIARIINEKGTVLEGNFTNNQENGWIRMIFNNQPNYALSWFKNGKFHGYCYRKDVEECTIDLEALFEDDEFVKFDDQIKKGKNA